MRLGRTGGQLRAGRAFDATWRRDLLAMAVVGARGQERA